WKISEAIGLGSRINMIMQAAFFKLTEVIPIDDAIRYLKEGIEKTYKKKGQQIIEMNWKAVDEGINAIQKVEVPE
ncbi:2-oxoacid:acceptor oxidoreductase family protein, partial [Klebsiella pneumoniae]|nr:2-oxoacid:acceptor oxidoreductase family protein [Klebsiella pneumoniae]